MIHVYHVYRWSTQQTCCTNPTMHQSHIPQCNIQNRNAHISVVNVALWDMEKVQCGICEIVKKTLWNAQIWHHYNSVSNGIYMSCYIRHYNCQHLRAVKMATFNSLTPGRCRCNYTPRTTKLLGGILVSLRPSIRPSIRPSVPPAVSAL